MVDAVQVGTTNDGVEMATDRVIQATDPVDQQQSGIEQHTISTQGGRQTAANTAPIEPDKRDTRAAAIPDTPMAPTLRWRTPEANTLSSDAWTDDGAKAREYRDASLGETRSHSRWGLVDTRRRLGRPVCGGKAVVRPKGLH